MKVPDWRSFALNEGVLPEPIADDNRIILWLPGSCDRGFQQWERISNVVRAEIRVEQGICATAATSIRARQQVRGFFGKLLQRFRGTPGDRSWVLPNGDSADQEGKRQTDLMLVWAEDETTPLDETRIKSRWPVSKRFQPIGKNLFLVSGIEPPEELNEAELLQPQGNPRALAEQLLAAARQTGDQLRVASVLTDLGILQTREGDAPRGVAHLEEALAIVRRLGDRSREGDVLGNLGLATLAIGQARRALEFLEQALAYARAAGDRFAEKTALFNLALFYSSLSDAAQTLTFFGQALTLAREVGDRPQEADLLWHLSIQHAELGQRDQAIAMAQAAIGFFEQMGNPQVGAFDDHLHRYRMGETGVGLGETKEAGPVAPPGAFFAGAIVTSGWGFQLGPGSGQEQTPSGPGWLRMAFSAAKSMTRFVGSGLKTVSSATYRKRLRTCAPCEHHTGLRCKVCGCFTKAKAWMPHEDCPIGKWPPGA